MNTKVFLKAAVATAVIFSASAVRIAAADEVDDLLDDLVRYQEKKRAAAESAMVVAEPMPLPPKEAVSGPERQGPRGQLRSRRLRQADQSRALSASAGRKPSARAQ